MLISYPALMFLGESDNLTAKTAHGIFHWRPQLCLAQLRLPGATATLGLPEMTPAEAVAAGARSMIIGVANDGGFIPDAWRAVILSALAAGLDVAAGLHDRLIDSVEIAAAARKYGRRLFDVRHPRPESYGIGTGRRRPGRRLLTVGTDCAVGKMFTSLAIEKELLTRGVKADFRASGQTGIFIAGGGVSVDAVVSDFVAGAAELLSPSSDDPDHWDIVEGQGSLFHPSYAAVTLGLIHGSQPDALVLCHDATRTVIDGLPDYAIPDLSKCMDLNLRVAALTNPEARFVGVALNTSKLSRVDAEALITRTTRELGLPCCDPVRTGVDAIVDEMLRPSRA